MVDIVTKIEQTIEESIESFFSGKDVKTSHVLDILFPVERRVRSLIGGLETSMGTRVWEPLAKLFAEENGFEVLDQGNFNAELCLPTPPNWALHCLNAWKQKREDETEKYLEPYIAEMRQLAQDNDLSSLSWGQAPKGRGIDIWVKKDDVEYIYDIKTNQINAGSGPKFNESIMAWYMYRILKDPSIQIKCMIAFPFNPHAPTNFWTKEGGKAKPLVPSEDVVVESEFWDFLLGQKDSWHTIINAFEELSKKGFDEKFRSIFYK